MSAADLRAKKHLDGSANFVCSGEVEPADLAKGKGAMDLFAIITRLLRLSQSDA